MIRLDDWKRMSLVERRDYEWWMRRAKRILLVCGVVVAILVSLTALALSLHSKGII